MSALQGLVHEQIRPEVEHGAPKVAAVPTECSSCMVFAVESSIYTKTLLPAAACLNKKCPKWYKTKEGSIVGTVSSSSTKLAKKWDPREL